MGYNGRNIAADERPEPSAQDQDVFEIRLAGKSPGDIAKALHMTVPDIDAALVRACPRLDAENMMVAFALESEQLERLAAVHYKKALEGDIPSTAVRTKLNERLSAMHGWDRPSAIRRDPILLQPGANPPLNTTEQIDRAIARVTGRTSTEPEEPLKPVASRDDQQIMTIVNRFRYDPLYGGTPKEPEQAKPEPDKTE